jgi:hypothetical protein
MKHCQQCNLDFPDSFRFCGSCGRELGNSLSCQGCGELVESKWTFCTNCGRELLPEGTTGQAFPSEVPEFRDIPAANPTSVVAPLPAAEQRWGKVTPQEWYATSDLFEDTSETTATPIPRQDLVPKTTIAPPRATGHPQVGNGKAAPTLTMLAAYGESGRTASPEWQRHHVLLVALLLLGFFGVLVFGGWYWWTHSASGTQSPPQAASTNAPAAADSSSSASAASSATTTSAPIATRVGAEEEWKRLREQRISAKPSESSAIIVSLDDAEKKYPRDYRFPYERAKLSIKGITSHHEAFNALSLAAEKAIDNGKTQEMLDSLTADKDGDFYKLSRGHHEWQALVQALSNKDKHSLNELHH